MGICHGKLFSKSSCHPNNGDNHTNEAPRSVTPTGAITPLHHAATAASNLTSLDNSGGVAKNHVVPHPPPVQLDASTLPSRQAAEARSPQQPGRSTRIPLERSHSLTASNVSAPQFGRSVANNAASKDPSKGQEQRDAVRSPRPTWTRHTSLKPEIHRSGSEARLVGGFATTKTNRRKKKPISVSLEVILHDERARSGFFKFIQATAIQERIKEDREEGDGGDSPSAKPLAQRSAVGKVVRPTTDYREDCALFWLEVNDLLKIPSGGTGSFQISLMSDLFEVYVAKGAVRELPMVSAVERDSLAQYIADRNLDRALLSFKMLLLDSLEVVTASFDEYIRAEGKLGYSHATRAKSVRNVLARLAKLNIGHQGDRRSHLHDIISTPAVCRMFREFLEERNSIETLLFVVDALAFEDLVNTFERESSLDMDEDGSHQDYCLRQAQKIFNKYVRYGSKAEICLGTAVKEKLLQEIVEYPLGADIFNEAVLLCSAELVNSHLDMFYRSRPYLEYQAVVRKGTSHSQRRSVQILRPLEPIGAAAAETNGPVVVPVSLAPSASLPNLSDILNGTGVNFFRDFLKEEGSENTLFFYKEVGEFQRLPHGQKHYIQNKARKIFEKFVRRGGKLEIDLPAEIRRDILWKLAAPTESTFSDAQRYVFNVWEHKYLDKFRVHALHQDMMSQLAAAPSSSAQRTGTGGGGNGESLTGVAPSTGGGDWVDVSKITLREFLDVEFLRRFFRLFLEKEQCANELFFYFEIAHFQQFPTSDYLTRQAKKLFNRFCVPTSREYVIVSESTQREIQENLEHARPAMFNKAQEEIFAFFATTLFPKFQQSDIYEAIRITPQELRVAKLSAVGAASRRDLNSARTGGRSSATTSVGHGSISVEGGGARVRASVFSVAMAATVTVATRELDEEAVSVSMILENPDTRALFLFFAEEIFCTESIYFWLDCNEYKDIPHRSYLKLRAQKIFRKYIAGNAKLQVNLESALVRDIQEHIDDPSRTLFLAAQRSITKMLERDTLPKFRRSKHFQPCLELLRNAQDT